MKQLTLIALALTAAAPADATVYNAFASFNGTQGAGGFFYGSLTANVFTSFSACGPIDFPLTACLGSGSYPYFGVAASAGPHFGATLPVDRLLTHTTVGVGGLMGWRAPVAGFYNIDLIVSLHHQDRLLGNGIGVTYYVQTFGQAPDVSPRFVLNQAERTLSGSRSFGVGDTFGVVLDANGSNAYDLSGINVVVSSLSAPGVPEPQSWAMLIAGFALTGAAMRRRAPASVNAR